MVLDTNVWVSGLLLPKSIPARIISSWKNAAFSIVVSSFIADEIKEVFKYPKIKKRLLLSDEEIEEFFSFLHFFSDWVDIKNDKKDFKKLRDQDDAPILSTFILGGANYLVTGDKDLLVLSEQYSIVTPAQFVEFL